MHQFTGNLPVWILPGFIFPEQVTGISGHKNPEGISGNYFSYDGTCRESVFV